MQPPNPEKRSPELVSIRPMTMSDKTDGPGNDTSILTKTKTKTERPPLYKVMLLNDDYTPMEFVVHVLERFFRPEPRPGVRDHADGSQEGAGGGGGVQL